LPRLACTFRRFIEIISQHGFELHRQGATSHRRYRGVVDDKVRFVDLAAHSLNEEIRPGTLKSMIRQSGLPERLFRR
jgi:predicted RNA binding protein YcfA (HicA-like mRNA interferase family)